MIVNNFTCFRKKISKHGQQRNKQIQIIQIYEATDKNDLDFAIAIFRVGTHIDNEEDQSDHVGTYRGIRAAR